MALVDLGATHSVNATKVEQYFLDGTLAIERDLLWHVADAFPRNPRLWRTSLVPTYENCARVQFAKRHDAGEQRRLPTAGSTQ